MEVVLSPGDLVLNGNLAPSPKGCAAPLFSAHVYCSQTAAWIKMPLGTEVGVGQDNIVLDGDPAPPPQKGAEPPRKFSAHVYCGQMAGWIKMALGTQIGLGPDDIVLDGGPSSPLKKGCSLPSFRPVCFVAKWLYVSGYHLVQRLASA